MPQPKPTGPRCLGMDERIFIADGPVCGLSMSAIASRLGRSRSTVCREVARNRDRGTGRYTPYRAGEMAAARRRRPKPRKLEDRRLAAEYPDNEGMNASTETITRPSTSRRRGSSSAISPSSCAAGARPAGRGRPPTRASRASASRWR